MSTVRSASASSITMRRGTLGQRADCKRNDWATTTAPANTAASRSAGGPVRSTPSSSSSSSTAAAAERNFQRFEDSTMAPPDVDVDDDDDGQDDASQNFAHLAPRPAQSSSSSSLSSTKQQQQPDSSLQNRSSDEAANIILPNPPSVEKSPPHHPNDSAELKPAAAAAGWSLAMTQSHADAESVAELTATTASSQSTARTNSSFYSCQTNNSNRSSSNQYGYSDYYHGMEHSAASTARPSADAAAGSSPFGEGSRAQAPTNRSNHSSSNSMDIGHSNTLVTGWGDPPTKRNTLVTGWGDPSPKPPPQKALAPEGSGAVDSQTTANNKSSPKTKIVMGWGDPPPEPNHPPVSSGWGNPSPQRCQPLPMGWDNPSRESPNEQLFQGLSKGFLLESTGLGTVAPPTRATTQPRTDPNPWAQSTSDPFQQQPLSQATTAATQSRQPWASSSTPQLTSDPFHQQSLSPEFMSRIRETARGIELGVQAPKSMLHSWYGKNRTHTIQKDDYVVWNDGGPPHALRYTSIFCCPLTGMLFPAGPYQNCNSSDQAGNSLYWFTKKVGAEHGAAARAMDYFRTRQYLDQNSPSSLPPLLLIPETRTTGEPDKDVISRWTPNNQMDLTAVPPAAQAKLEKLQQLAQLKAQHRALLQGEGIAPPSTAPPPAQAPVQSPHTLQGSNLPAQATAAAHPLSTSVAAPKMAPQQHQQQQQKEEEEAPWMTRPKGWDAEAARDLFGG